MAGNDTIDYSALDGAVGQNWYDLDPDLRDRVRTDCPPEDREWADALLRRFGKLVGDRIARNADTIDASPPQLVRWDRWANEVDTIVHHPATLDSKAALWDCGYVSGFAADARRRRRSTPAVVLGAANYLLSQADTGMVCSLGMTSGVASLVEAYAPADVREDLLRQLRASTFADGADGSMFLTERDGGSDLGRTVHCTARDLGDGRALIDGEKWFCSNVDGAVAVLLARFEGAPSGPGGLGLYLVPRYRDDGTRNSMTIRRLKPKLGTRSVPTGEIEFHGALAYALRFRSPGGATASSDAGGLNRMMEMVNGSRFGVAMMGLGIARRCFLEAAIWAHHRSAKGRLLVDLPLVREQLVDLQCELEAAFALGFECAAASRREDGERLRRITVPAAKVRLCRLGVDAASAAIELHGGNGYCEDWGLTRQLRDAQCHPIWEGTENICALDVLRAIRRHRAHEAVLSRVDQCLEAATRAPAFTTEAAVGVGLSRRRLAAAIAELPKLEPERAEAGALQLTMLLVETLCAGLLLEQSVRSPHKGLMALRYVRRHVAPRAAWHDRIAVEAGRELLSWAPIPEGFAAKAAQI